jgi:O-antigen ligase
MPERRSDKISKILFAFLVFSIALYISSFYFPQFNEFVERVLAIGRDESSLTRLSMWTLAIDNFASSPFWGIGWGGFRYQFNQLLFNPSYKSERYAFLNAHNVYIQLLAETGIIGFTLFILNAFSILKNTIAYKKTKLTLSITEKTVLNYSLLIQIFFYLYALTGNCLYDMTFGFFTVAVGMSVGIFYQNNI